MKKNEDFILNSLLEARIKTFSNDIVKKDIINLQAHIMGVAENGEISMKIKTNDYLDVSLEYLKLQGFNIYRYPDIIIINWALSLSKMPKI